jgi:hypothetical protein
MTVPVEPLYRPYDGHDQAALSALIGHNYKE